MNPYALDQLAVQDAKEDTHNKFFWDKPEHWLRDKRLEKLDVGDREEYLKLYARSYVGHCEQIDQRARRWLCV